ncbi:MAG: uracil-DNA glycosylase [Armatimonadetes bacterium]|nr:uracil-DNA glycosylase [Armatimonadota bacterium]
MRDSDAILEALRRDVIACRRCPRLVAHRARVAAEKRREFAATDYWARPVPGFGDPGGRLLILGLAPAAHGANRTGRMFTGDLPNGASVWLMRALHRAGFANQPQSVDRDDGLRLLDAYVTAAVRCAPPDNRPTPAESDTCFAFLRRERLGLERVRLVVALGGFAFAAALRLAAAEGVTIPRPQPRFRHGQEYQWRDGAASPSFPVVLCTYHPSRQNTNTGRLTETMLDAIFARARAMLDTEDHP